MTHSRTLRLLSLLAALAPLAALAEVNPDPSPAQLEEANKAVTGGGIVFPPDSNVLNVRAFGARGDGTTDDTAAIQAAYNKTGLIYFPNGTYLVTGQIKAPPRKGSAPARRIIQGQSRDGAVIKLQDSLPAFASGSQSLLVVSSGVAQAFRNSVRDITIDVGSGNPGAVALEFFASNQGAVDNVVLKSSDPALSGHTGLLLQGDNGPLLISRLQVTGFDTGIMADANALAVLKKVRIEGQRELGINARNKTFIHGLESRNNVTAVRIGGNPFVLLDGNLVAAEAAQTAGLTAIEHNGGAALVRNLKTEGYGTPLLSADGGPGGSAVELWTSKPPMAFGGNLETTVDVPMQEVPEVAWGDLKTWRSIADDGGMQNDMSSALKDALRSGARTVYFPAGAKFNANGRFTVPASVERIIGLESEIRGNGLTLVFEEGTKPVVIEHIDAMYGKITVENRSKRPIIARSAHIDAFDFAEGAGDLFVEDITGFFVTLRGQNLWAWQLNLETGVNVETGANLDVNPGVLPMRLTELPKACVENEGGNAFIFGMKTEKNRTKIWTKKGGRTSAFCYIMSNWSSNVLPMFVNEDSQFSSFVAEFTRRDAPFETVLRKVCRGKVEELKNADLGTTGRGGVSIPLLTSSCNP